MHDQVIMRLDPDRLITHALERRLISAHNNLVDPSTVPSDELCGCFYCLKVYHSCVFTPEEIERLQIFSPPGACLFCGIDSVIGSATGEPITRELLTLMRAYFF